jgi:Carboxypeptidase regulatory-like domain/Ankyrin repeats (3 copies)
MPEQNSILDRINIPSPCAARWDEMVGNEEVRFCLHCSKHVNNLSQMTRKRAIALVTRSKGQLCVRYERRADGRLRTAEPQSPLYQIKRRASRLAAGAFTAALTLCSSAAAQTGGAQVQESAAHSVEQVGQRTETPATSSSGASLEGTIKDPADGVIPEAKITLLNESDGREQVTVSTYDGRYYFNSLAAGTYTLKVEAVGFTPYERKGLVVSAPVTEPINVSMPPEFISMGGAIVIVAEEPLVSAASENDLPKVKMLIIAGVDVNRRDKNTDSTALEEAVKYGNREMVRVLLEAGADINARNGSAQTPLMMMDDDASEGLVWDLIGAGAKVGDRDEDGDTALILATEWCEPEVLRALIEGGAKVNARNKTGETALMKAAEEGKLESVRLLIAYGAKINTKNDDGETALKLAQDNDHEDVAGFLRAHSAAE